MGPISVDGSGQNNLDRSEGPRGGVDLYSNGGIPRSLRPDTERDNRFGREHFIAATSRMCIGL